MPSPADARQALTAWPQVAPSAAVEAHRVGHINDTYVVDGRFILQRLNGAVFPNPQAVMRNLAKVVAHEGGRRLVAPIVTRHGEAFVADADASIWRLFPRIPARTFQTLPDALLEPAAAAFGGFLATFADFDDELEPAIDGFHDLGRYLAGFDATSKTADVDDESRAVDALRREFRPSRATSVIHGDGKINNLLFHPQENTVVAVVDLDTVMRGDPAWDFGDLVRSAFVGGEETAAAEMSLPRFKLLCRGFVNAFGPLDDIARFAAAPAYMSFMLAVRFLTDHLRGDVYFKVSQRGDNLLRARSQLALTNRLRAAADGLTATLSAEVQAASSN